MEGWTDEGVDGWRDDGPPAAWREDEVTPEELVVMQFNFLPDSCALPPARLLWRHLKWRDGGREAKGWRERDNEEAATLQPAGRPRGRLQRRLRAHLPKSAAQTAASLPESGCKKGCKSQQQPSGYQWQHLRGRSGHPEPTPGRKSQKAALRIRKWLLRSAAAWILS